MKSRILDSLYVFSQPQILDQPEPLFQALCDEADLNPAQLQKKCGLILKQILHNYAFFEVSTIDRFNHKILKTFARDLQLSQNFEVELDVDSLLERAVSNLLERTGENPYLTDALLDFSLEKIEDDKSWNIAHDLVESGKLLFQENHAEYLKGFEGQGIPDFKHAQKTIQVKIKVLEKKALSLSQSTLKELADRGFVPEDFPRQTLPNHLKKILGKEYTIKVLYSNKLEENLKEGKVLKSNDKRNTSELSAYILGQFTTLKRLVYERAYLKNVYNNLAPMTVLNEISKEIKKLEEEEDIIPISALNQLISKEIKDQPVPFIYERLGEKYRHYFVDEFQDTSRLQWENLIPLVSNALQSEDERGETGSLFLVGDIKQAIYRWRGGSSEQFLNLLNQSEKPFIAKPKIENLETNWRSFSEIITFNNAFFSYASQFLRDSSYRTLFQNSCIQKTNSSIGGYVKIKFIDGSKGDRDELYCRNVLDTITQLTEQKYRYTDICILVRDNTKGGILANFLSEHRIPIISSDSLLLAQNTSVNFLISLLKLLENSEDKLSGFEILSFLANQTQVENKHDFIAAHLNDTFHFLQEEFNFNSHEMVHRPVSEILEDAIVKFKLYQESQAYLTFLMDEVLVVESKQGSGIMFFLEHWAQKKTLLSITAPEAIDAVKIMTIHKAKGLEFPIVLFPYADSVINDKRKKKKIWVRSNTLEDHFGASALLLNSTSEMEEYAPEAKNAYLEEERKTQMDALNILYVALTRAERGLYIFTEKTKPKGSLENANSYAELFYLYLTEKSLLNVTLDEYAFGQLPKPQKPGMAQQNNLNTVQYTVRPSLVNPFRISTKQGQLWGTGAGKAIEIGNLIHFVLAQIDFVDNAPKVIHELESDGIFEGYETESIVRHVFETLKHPLLQEYFTEKYTIYNEREILTRNENLRPDRVAVLGEEAIIIDFKTGEPRTKHKSQLLQYEEALKDMGFSIKNSIIVYIGEEIRPLYL